MACHRGHWERHPDLPGFIAMILHANRGSHLVVEDYLMERYGAQPGIEAGRSWFNTNASCLQWKAPAMAGAR